MMLRLTVTMIAVVLAGCSDAPAEKPKRDRQKESVVKLARTPDARAYRFDNGELRVLDVPVPDGSGGVDTQRCFIWRDHQFQNATLSCGQMPEIVLTN